ncbi:antitoxin Xre-like helix-turn-helix domain-containing protein [Hymenobacter artigasi]|uniref:Toxin-antitoxin system antitoxin component (TIGR02293 family) n=1 Tax=Hymenobacter artigasi TaxID=2719616 RepID=A0ABX1HJI9_9BACT|nr:antitoxin Xre-like helix-turn-helix domain-containing protein [Hymenobacter artigasi]NKI89312.1 putative toxin-antitoxin system antitoxin component (TIGR02293 family) [Hymenobacter artigasi]
MAAFATPPVAVYSPALRSLQATVADSFALVMEARTGVPAKTAFDVASLLKLSADELAALLHTTTKTLRAYREGKKRLGPAASEQILKLLALARLGEESFGALPAFRRWLDKPAYGLDNQPPLALLETSGGIDLVAAEVARIAYGDFA